MHDLFSEARMHSSQMREFFDAYIAEGFTEEQAFTLVQIVLRAIVGLRG